MEIVHNNNVRLKQTPQVQLRVTCQVCKKVSEFVIIVKRMILLNYNFRNYVINIFYVHICVMFIIYLLMIYV